VALPAFAAARRAVARLLLSAGSPAVQQAIDISWPPVSKQQTRSSGVQRPDWQTDRRTDARQLNRSCSAYYAGSDSNEHSALQLLTVMHDYVKFR